PPSPPPKNKPQAGAEPSPGPPPPVLPDTIKNARAAPAPRLAPYDAGPAEHVFRASYAEDPEQRAERDTARKARGAGILFESAPAPQEERSQQEPPARSPEAPPGSSAASTTSGPSDPNLQEHKNAFLGGK